MSHNKWTMEEYEYMVKIWLSNYHESIMVTGKYKIEKQKVEQETALFNNVLNKKEVMDQYIV